MGVRVLFWGLRELRTNPMRHLGKAPLLLALSVMSVLNCAGGQAEMTQPYAEIESMMVTNPDGAQKRLRTLLDVNRKDAEAWLLLGKLSEQKGDFDQAEVAYRQAASLGERGATGAIGLMHNNRASAWVKAGELAIEAGNLEAAQ